MEFKKILSGKGKYQILDLGYRFQWNKGPQGPNDIAYFTCTEKGCKATLSTYGRLDGDLTLKKHKVELHNHRPDAAENIVSETMHKYRNQIDENPEVSAKQLFDDLANQALESVSGTPNKLDLAKKLPTYRKARDTAYRKKREKRPNLPKDIDDVNVRLYTDLLFTKSGEEWYLGRTKGGAEVWMTPTGVAIGGHTNSGGSDATFKITPFPFFQTFLITATYNENTYLIATALMPNKLESTYTEVLELVKAHSESKGVPLDFAYMHMDCEMAVINSFRHVFPGMQIRLCSFHVIDAMRRHANTTGLRPVIKHNPNFSQFYYRVRQIYFFPITIWPRLWKLLKSKLDKDTLDIPAVEGYLHYLVCLNE